MQWIKYMLYAVDKVMLYAVDKVYVYVVCSG